MGRILIDSTTMRAALNRADDAFWTEVAKVFPQIKTGDLSPDAHVPFMKAAREAIEAWVDENTPPLALPEATGYYWILASHGDTGHKTWQIANYLGDDRWRRFGFAHQDTADHIGIVEYRGPLTLADLASPPTNPGPLQPVTSTTVGEEQARLVTEQVKAEAGLEPGKVPDRAFTWRFSPPPMGSEQAAKEDWHAFVNVLPKYKGWMAAWEYPGFLCWHHDKLDLDLVATPDWESREAEIVIDLQDKSGERMTFGPTAWDRLIPWPKDGRNVETYMQRVAPLIDEIMAVADEYRNAVRRTLIDGHLDEEADFDLDEVPRLVPIANEIPGAWVTVQLWIDARDLTGEPVSSSCGTCHGDRVVVIDSDEEPCPECRTAEHDAQRAAKAKAERGVLT